MTSSAIPADTMEAAIYAVDKGREDFLLAKASENAALLRRVAIGVVHGAILAERQRFSRATPEMIAAAWATWKPRNPGSLGPGPAFVEAINAALAAAPKGGVA